MYNKYFKSDDDFEILDIYDLFNYYNTFFFQDRLEKCFVEWSQKMTLCAGTCTHSSYDSCTIKLSAPLLKYRTANQLKQTLLHEMIHAFLFLTNPKACLTEGGHGKEFKQIMTNINNITNLQITIYHKFHDEVNMHRNHIWRCNGSCRERPPFYGYVKRAMNRKPQPADRWFSDHQKTCGGQFIKESEPEQRPKPLRNSKKSKEKLGQNKMWGKGKSIEDYLKEMNKPKQSKSEPRQTNLKKFLTKENKQQQASSKLIKDSKTIADYCKQIQQQQKQEK